MANVTPPTPGSLPEKGPSEPPATVGNSGPILQSEPQSFWPYAVIIGLILILLGGGWYLLKNVKFDSRGTINSLKEKAQDLGSSAERDSAGNECFTFQLPEKLIVNEFGPACSVTADNYNYDVSAGLLPAEVTEAGLKRFATADFTKFYPEVSTTAQEATTFAGQPAYAITWMDGEKKSSRYYIYNKQTDVTVRGQQFKAYLVTASSRQDPTVLINTVEKSWKWKNWNDAEASAYKEVPVSASVTDCYSITPPADISVRTYRSSQCEIRMANGRYDANNLRVRSLIGDGNSAKDNASEWKSNTTAKVISEAAVKVDGRDAYKAVYRYGNGSDHDLVIVFVPTGSKYMAINRTPGFEITGSYDNQSGGKQAFDAMLTNWKWR